LSTAKDAAAAAVAAVRTQTTKEILWREWLYCELGGAVAGASSANWWTFITSDSTISGAGSAPKFCTVPAVADDGNSATTQRPAIRYFTSSTAPGSGAVDGKDAWASGTPANAPNYLSAEPVTGTEKWTATLLKT
jgi:hypothetical protein